VHEVFRADEAVAGEIADGGVEDGERALLRALGEQADQGLGQRSGV
jgi:hypothetical protein